MNSNVNIPQVSVIIPLYNKAPYIKRALDSVLAQTVQDFEVVVVGGKSTDGGEGIVKGYTDPRIRFIQEASKGVSAARNQGVDAARAELVAFLDADDEWLPEFLETILRLRWKWPEAGLYGTGYQRVFKNKKVLDCYVEKEYGDHILKPYFHIKNNYPLMIIATSGMTIPKKIFCDIGGFPLDYPQSEDRALRAKIALSYPVAYSPEIMLTYYFDPETTYARFNNEISDPFSDYINSIPVNELKKREDYYDIIEFCERAQLGFIRIYIRLGNNKLNIVHKLNVIKSKSCQKQRIIYFIYLFIPKRIIKYII